MIEQQIQKLKKQHLIIENEISPFSNTDSKIHVGDLIKLA